MSVFALKRGLRQVLLPVVGICTVAYFAYHSVHGDRGFVAHNRLVEELDEARDTLGRLHATRSELQHRVDLMASEALDPDSLEESARRMLNYVHPDDVIIFLQTDQPPPVEPGS